MPQRRQTRKGHQSAVSISILDTALVIDRRRIITDLQRQLAEGTARSAIAGSFASGSTAVGGVRCTRKEERLMPLYEKGNLSIHYEEAGPGFRCW